MKQYFYIIFTIFLVISCGKVLKTHVKGKVLNPITGQGIENVRVILQKSGSGIPSGLKTVEAVYTDAGGNFDISARTLKGLTASVVLDGNEYYSIGWKKDGEVYSILSPKKGNVTNADFHAVPYGNLQINIKNTSCFNSNDELSIFRTHSIAGFYDGVPNPAIYNGCIDQIGNMNKAPMGWYKFSGTFTKNNIVNPIKDSIYLNNGETKIWNINY